MTREEKEVLNIVREVERKLSKEDKGFRLRREKSERRYNIFSDNITEEQKLKIAQLDPTRFETTSQQLKKLRSIGRTIAFTDIGLSCTLLPAALVLVALSIISPFVALPIGLICIGTAPLSTLSDFYRNDDWDLVIKYYNNHKEELENLKTKALEHGIENDDALNANLSTIKESSDNQIKQKNSKKRRKQKNVEESDKRNKSGDDELKIDKTECISQEEQEG